MDEKKGGAGGEGGGGGEATHGEAGHVGEATLDRTQDAGKSEVVRGGVEPLQRLAGQRQ